MAASDAESAEELSTGGATSRPLSASIAVRVGMDRTALRQVFGEPTVKVTGMENGQTVENYVYSWSDRDTITFTRMENGRVVAVETVSQ